MEKLIDDIIELILGDMDCHHEVDHDEDGVHISVDYNLKDEKKLRGMIKALIKASFNLRNKSLMRLAEDLGVSFSAAKIISDHARPQVTEEFIEKIHRKFYKCRVTKTMIMQIADEIGATKKVTEEWIEEKATSFVGELATRGNVSMNLVQDFIRSLFKEIGK